MKQFAKKYVIAGLDNSGKTSILLSLQGISNLLSYYSLEPTLGLKIEQLIDKQTDISIWELGGQEEYRNTYLESNNLSQYFEGMKKFLYVIDVQAVGRYPESLLYLTSLYPSIQHTSPEEIIFFVHKFDPDLKLKPEFSDDKIFEKLIHPIRNIFTDFKEMQFFKSTIFTVFQKSQLFM